MKTFKFEGCSDDTFGEYAITSDDFDNCASGDPIKYRLATPDGAGIVITGQHSPEPDDSGCWMIGVNLIDEDKPVDWKILTTPAHKRSRNQLIVEAPDDAELTCLTREE